METAEAWTDFEKKLTSPKWRLNNLYSIENKEAEVVLFQMNPAQEHFYDRLHNRNIVLKARQRGFSTLIDLLGLDQCLFNSNTNFGIVADTLDNAKALLANKIKFPYRRLDPALRDAVRVIKSNETEIQWSNGSSVRVGASLRSGTYQILHISEYGKICAKSPEKAKEIRTGALNTISPDSFGFIESTAEGQEGDFYDKTREARALALSGRELKRLDWKFHFYSWIGDGSYIEDPNGVSVSAEMREYFSDLKSKHNIKPSAEQKAWYVLKRKEQKDEMKREYPSTPDEAFEAAIEGAYFSRQMAGLREMKRITSVPYDAALPVNTFWDLGMSDSMTIWLHQYDGSCIASLAIMRIQARG
ncbi:MAG: hypothetical protein JKY96_04840 [Phycisphaerales bacterium]|nr:hypothetical protein [Phycisphaerales bacterium]